MIIASHITETTTRDENGRYVVNLPKKDSLTKLGDSRSQGLKRFYSLEKRLESTPELKKEYVEFMEEYIEMGHMSKINDAYDSEVSYYIPHHPVFKPTSTSTKLRVVFDASARTSSGMSLNDILAVGPTIQSDLNTILLKFRLHPYAFIADTTKMYRQILVDLSDRHLQRVFWLSSAQEPLKYSYLWDESSLLM